MNANVKNINQNNFQNICRMCLNICDIKFFGDHVISKLFYKLTDIHFKTNDGLPKQICLNCFEKINEIHEFAFQCKRSHSTLTNCLNTILSEKQNPDKEEKYELVVKLEENITFDEVINTNVIDENLNQTNDDINDELKTTENDFEVIPYECKRNEISESMEINGGLQTNSFEDVADKKDDISNNDENWSGLETRKTRSSYKYLHKCEKCSESFTQWSTLKRHVCEHSGERPFKCNRCSKSFTKQCHLRWHFRSHKNVRLHKCDQCFRSFKRPKQLNSHMRTHSMERPYKCDLCPKSYVNDIYLLIHKRAHSGERPYKCEHCSKAFVYSSQLACHILIHNSERRFKCDQCPKSYSQSNYLETHMRIHSD